MLKKKTDKKKEPAKKKPATYPKGTAYEKHKTDANYWKAKKDKDHHLYIKAMSNAIQDYQNAVTLDTKHKQKWLKRSSKWRKIADSASKAEKRHTKAYNKATSYIEQAEKNKQYKANKAAVANAIADHKKGGWKNEGNAAIYRTDGHSSNIIYISPSDAEEESRDAEATSWPVDEDAPRSNYVRNTSDSRTVGGIITGNDRAEANKKYAQLIYWYHHNTDLTYEGDFKQDHLFITNISQSFHTYRDNLEVSITFTHVRAAAVTRSSTGNNAKPKKSKSSKTTRGSRNKRYTAITVKKGQTLLGISRKYHKSVAWLQKVNNIKNPNEIDAGQKLYVKKRVIDAKGVKKTVYRPTKNNNKKIRVR